LKYNWAITGALLMAVMMERMPTKPVTRIKMPFALI
jgi:hypothetical protein